MKKPKLTQTQIFILGMLYVVFTAYIWKQFINQSVDYFTPLMAKTVVIEQVAVEVEVEPKDQLRVEKYIQIAKEKGFTKVDELAWLLGNLKGESRWAESKLYHINNDGTLDRGECMLNNHWYDWVSDECAWDTNCCVNVMIDEYRKGNGNNWLAPDNL